MNIKKINTDKYKNKGLTGLVNLGNTCFLNSCIQILNHTYELVEFLNSEKSRNSIKQELPESILIQEWMELRDIMWSKNGIVSPNKFVYTVHHIAKEKKRELFTGWAQNDISEFILFMIECIHNSISHSVTIRISGQTQNELDNLAVECYTMLKNIYLKEYSYIMDIFYAIYVSQITTMDGKTVYSNTPEFFFILDLPIPERNNNCTIYDCFDLFTKSETLENENAWYNQKTKNKEAVKKQISFWNFPNILVVSFKRFSNNGEHKRQDLIDFPLDNLNLSKYVKGYNPNSFVYDLYGVCNHSGSVMGGHYTSFVKNAANEWIEYNDSNVNIIHRREHIVTPMAYCLFYRKKNKL